jgi:hypothetical protein
MPLRHVVQWGSISLLAVASIATASGRLPSTSELGSAGPALETARVSDGRVQRELSQRPDWVAFQARYGDWHAVWNEVTGTPHRAYGPSIPLAGFAADPVAVDRALRQFIASEPMLFAGSPELETVSTELQGSVWYVRYNQTFNGIPVLLEDWEFRVSTDGRLMAFGADARRVPAGLPTRPRIDASAARAATRAGLEFNAATDRSEGGTDLFYLPVRTPAGEAELRLVTKTMASSRSQLESRVDLVDTQTGAVVWRKSGRANAISGAESAFVQVKYPDDGYSTFAIRNAYVIVGGVRAITDSTGHYSATPPASPVCVTASLSGAYCRVVNNNGSSASMSQCGVANGSTLNIFWAPNNSTDAERDAYYHVNWAHDWVKRVDSTYTANDFPIVTNVNINDDECSAYWDQVTESLNFSYAGPTCANTGQIADVVWHEYAHAVNFLLYFAHGAPLGMTNEALDDGMADAFSALVGDDCIIGDGFFGPGTFLRTACNTNHWPEDDNPDPQTAGTILSGAFWDLRLLAGMPTAEHVHHFAKYGLPDDPDNGIAFNEMFLECLIADDNDGNLSNGTPHFSSIVTAFNNHGIGTNFWVLVGHTPLDDQPTSGPFPINATMQYTGPVGGLGPVTLFYSINGSAFESRPMLPTGNPDEYGAEITATSYGIVKYYIRAQDVYGGTRVEPAGAPTRDIHAFVAGPSTTAISLDMETNPNWVVGATDDLAATGVWVRADPYGTIAQPEDDHSVLGTQCWVTGNNPSPDPPGLDDVDGGKTTLTTNAFNATVDALLHPIISYWRWYSNNTGDAPGLDTWRVDISSNGGTTWVPIEATTASSNGWKRAVFLIERYVTPSTNMKMRLIAEDSGDPSLVEAAVDDWALIGYHVLDAPSASRPSYLALSQAYPNPFDRMTHMRFAVPRDGPVSLRVFDLGGRAVRTLAAGNHPAGEHSIEWDGRDDDGRLVSSGPYFVRLEFEGRVHSRAVVRIR